MSHIYKIAFISFYFALIISTERLYYQKLFNESLELIPKFQNSIPDSYTIWKIIAFFGTKPAFGVLYIILFLFMPVNKIFVMTFLLIFTGYVDHTGKIIYRQERPLWINPEININSQHSCGYGNPSGHSLSSSFWNFINFLLLFSLYIFFKISFFLFIIESILFNYF